MGKVIRNWLNNKNLVPYVLLAPFLILFLTFKAWPFIYSILLSFQKVQGVGAGSWTGISNYKMLLADPLFLSSLTATTQYTVGTLILLIPIPLILAAVLHSKAVKGAGIYQVIFFLPILTSLVVVGTVFRMMLIDDGLINHLLNIFGIPSQRWLGTAELVIPSLLIMAFWRWTGMNIVYFMSGLVNVPTELYEAATIDGANALKRFMYVTVPLLKPVIVFVLTISLIGGFQVFVEPYILFPSGITPGSAGLTMAYHLYRTAFGNFNMGYASTIGVVLTLIILVLSLLQFRLLGVLREDKE